MRATLLLAAVAPAARVLAMPANTITTFQPNLATIATYQQGFQNPTIQSSVGGQAICISGMINVTASAENYHINYSEPTNQTEVTALITQALAINSTLAPQILGAPNVVTGSYSIFSQICFPQSTSTINSTTVQFLIHGAGWDRTYWNVAPGYSYVDYAASQGYTTFLYDRLGVGLSDHPDGIQTLQLPMHVSVAHELIQLLRNGGIANTTFKHVVGVGHSFGSFQTNGVTAAYPKDLDAAVLTGWSNDTSGTPLAFAGIDLVIAAENQPLRFPNLSPSYLTGDAIAGNQFFFFHAPGYDPAMLELSENTKQTLSIGEFLVVSASAAPSFTGPIDVVAGQYDMPNCFGNCLVPYNKVAGVKEKYYPAASNSSAWYLGPDSGHGLNLHYAAEGAYEHIHDFIRTNGF